MAEVTLRSVEMFTEYEPDSYIEHISPTPLMMVVAAGDHLTVADEAQQVMEERGIDVDYLFGTMIEIPRAALTAGEIAGVEIGRAHV